MEEASQDNSQESQEEMQQSQEEASSQELPTASGKTSPDTGDREMSPDGEEEEEEKEEEEEEEEEEEWPPKFPTTLEGFGYAFNKGRVGYGLIPRMISLCMGMRPRLTKVSIFATTENIQGI